MLAVNSTNLIDLFNDKQLAAKSIHSLAFDGSRIECEIVGRDALIESNSPGWHLTEKTILKPLGMVDADYQLLLLAKETIYKQHANVINKVTESGFKIKAITTLQHHSEQTHQAFRYSLLGTALQADALEAKLNLVGELDVVLVPQSFFMTDFKLACFDMDSTLIQAEVIDELAKAHGIGKQVSAITESAMRGEIDFQQSFKARMALLSGLNEQVLTDIAKNLPLTSGVRPMMAKLKEKGIRTVILSGGFNYFAAHLQRELGFDAIHANALPIVLGKVTGETAGEIVDAEVKAKKLSEEASAIGCALSETIAVGDGANDLKMLNKAGLGVAFWAKPIVREQATFSLNRVGIDGLLSFLK